jgi:protease-4
MADMIPPPPPPPSASPQPPLVIQTRSRATGWIVTCVFLMMLLGLSMFFNLLGLIPKTKKARTETIFQELIFAGESSSPHKIAVIDIDGVISKYTEGFTGRDGMVGDIKQQLKLAVEDEDVKAIIIRIESPGGEVLASDELYNAILKAKMEKPLVASMGSVAASGGYYVAVGSDYIIADELTITGSIGVIMETLNYKGLMDKVGLQSHTFKSGKFKDLMNGSREPTPEEMALVQDMIMETYNKFVGIVATRRKMDVESLKQGLADGRILTGSQAKVGGFVDELGDFDVAIQRAKERAKITDARVFQYYVPFSFGRLFGFAAKSPINKLSVSFDQNPFKLESGKLYYLSSHLY